MSDSMDSDVREVIRRRIELRERDGHERLLLNHDALLALLDAADERDRLAAQVERVRALHCPYTTGVLMGDCANESCDHEGRCPTVPFEFCGGCNEVAEAADPYYMERDARISAYPCATIRALDGTDE